MLRSLFVLIADKLSHSSPQMSQLTLDSMLQPVETRDESDPVSGDGESDAYLDTVYGGGGNSTPTDPTPKKRKLPANFGKSPSSSSAAKPVLKKTPSSAARDSKGEPPVKRLKFEKRRVARSDDDEEEVASDDDFVVDDSKIRDRGDGQLPRERKAAEEAAKKLGLYRSASEEYEWKKKMKKATRAEPSESARARTINEWADPGWDPESRLRVLRAFQKDVKSQIEEVEAQLSERNAAGSASRKKPSDKVLVDDSKVVDLSALFRRVEEKTFTEVGAATKDDKKCREIIKEAILKSCCNIRYTERGGLEYEVKYDDRKTILHVAVDYSEKISALSVTSSDETLASAWTVLVKHKKVLDSVSRKSGGWLDMMKKFASVIQEPAPKDARGAEFLEAAVTDLAFLFIADRFYALGLSR
jgi:hypothetical protein